MAETIRGTRFNRICPTFNSRGAHRGLDTRLIENKSRAKVKETKVNYGKQLRECIKSGIYPEQSKKANIYNFIHKQFFDMCEISLLDEEINKNLFNSICSLVNQGLITVKEDGNFINLIR